MPQGNQVFDTDSDSALTAAGVCAQNCSSSALPRLQEPIQDQRVPIGDRQGQFLPPLAETLGLSRDHSSYQFDLSLLDF